MNFKGTSVVVCGGSDGIGKSCAILFANNGANVTIVARDKSKIENVINGLNSDQGQSHNLVCVDFNDPNELQRVIHDKLDKEIDILINNSGGPHGGLLEDSSLEEFKVAFDRLMLSSQVISSFALGNMKKQKYGRIINIISTSIKQVIPGLGVSNTIRGAVAQWGKTLALEVGEYGITVNNVLPGYTKTDRLAELSLEKSKALNISQDKIEEIWAESTALKRLAMPEEIAHSILFLASDKASYITGHNLAVDGGRYKT